MSRETELLFNVGSQDWKKGVALVSPATKAPTQEEGAVTIVWREGGGYIELSATRRDLGTIRTRVPAERVGAIPTEAIVIQGGTLKTGCSLLKEKENLRIGWDENHLTIRREGYGSLRYELYMGTIMVPYPRPKDVEDSVEYGLVATVRGCIPDARQGSYPVLRIEESGTLKIRGYYWGSTYEIECAPEGEPTEGDEDRLLQVKPALKVALLRMEDPIRILSEGSDMLALLDGRSTISIPFSGGISLPGDDLEWLEEDPETRRIQISRREFIEKLQWQKQRKAKELLIRGEGNRIYFICPLVEDEEEEGYIEGSIVSEGSAPWVVCHFDVEALLKIIPIGANLSDKIDLSVKYSLLGEEIKGEIVEICAPSLIMRSGPCLLALPSIVTMESVPLPQEE